MVVGIASVHSGAHRCRRVHSCVHSCAKRSGGSLCFARVHSSAPMGRQVNSGSRGFTWARLGDIGFDRARLGSLGRA